MSEIVSFAGGAAWSAPRLQRLARRVAAVIGREAALSAQQWFWAECEAPLDALARGRLMELLAAQPAPAQAPTDALVVLPRFGTISPWSSKATDIVRQCGLSAVRRVERGIVYRLEGFGRLSAAQRRDWAGHRNQARFAQPA